MALYIAANSLLRMKTLPDIHSTILDCSYIRGLRRQCLVSILQYYSLVRDPLGCYDSANLISRHLTKCHPHLPISNFASPVPQRLLPFFVSDYSSASCLTTSNGIDPTGNSRNPDLAATLITSSTLLMISPLYPLLCLSNIDSFGWIGIVLRVPLFPVRDGEYKKIPRLPQVVRPSSSHCEWHTDSNVLPSHLASVTLLE